MNTLHSSGRHYREEFEKPPKFRGRARLIIALVFLASVTHYLAFLGGAVMQAEQCRAQLAAANAARPTCASLVAKTALTQWNCDEREFVEHAATCASRGKRVPSWFKYIKPKSPPKEQ